MKISSIGFETETAFENNFTRENQDLSYILDLDQTKLLTVYRSQKMRNFRETSFPFDERFAHK